MSANQSATQKMKVPPARVHLLTFMALNTPCSAEHAVNDARGARAAACAQKGGLGATAAACHTPPQCCGVLCAAARLRRSCTEPQQARETSAGDLGNVHAARGLKAVVEDERVWLARHQHRQLAVRDALFAHTPHEVILALGTHVPARAQHGAPGRGGRRKSDLPRRRVRRVARGPRRLPGGRLARQGAETRARYATARGRRAARGVSGALTFVTGSSSAFMGSSALALSSLSFATAASSSSLVWDAGSAFMSSLILRTISPCSSASFTHCDIAVRCDAPSPCRDAKSAGTHELAQKLCYFGNKSANRRVRAG